MSTGAVLGIDKAAVASRFNRSAVTYDDHCRIQRLLAGRLMNRVETAADPARILELGCGTGHLTRLLATRFPGSRILAVDFADADGRARLRAGAGRAGSTLKSPTRRLHRSNPESFDMIVSNATVQWFDDPVATLTRLAGALKPGGSMLHSTFGPATFSEWRSLFEEDKAAGLPLRPAQEWAGMMAAAGLDRVGSIACLEELAYPGAADFLTELHATGATCRPDGAESGPLAPRTLRRALARYDDRYGSPRGCPCDLRAGGGLGGPAG